MKHLPEIHFKAIPHKEQQYETVGDYYKFGGMQFRVSKMNEDAEFLVLMHELTEWYLTYKRGIKIKDIDKFDINFEKEREMGLHNDQEEPGNSKNAPYYAEHKFATMIERLIARELKVNWKEYDKMICAL